MGSVSKILKRSPFILFLKLLGMYLSSFTSQSSVRSQEAKVTSLANSFSSVVIWEVAWLEANAVQCSMFSLFVWSSLCWPKIQISVMGAYTILQHFCYAFTCSCVQTRQHYICYVAQTWVWNVSLNPGQQLCAYSHYVEKKDQCLKQAKNWHCNTTSWKKVIN